MILPPIIIIRHPRERVSKCSLQPLRDWQGVTFYKASPSLSYDATGHILLSLGAPVIAREDAIATPEDYPDVLRVLKQQGREQAHGEELLRPVLLLDSTWRLLPQLEACVTGNPIRRTLPEGAKTAYPRVSKLTEDPHQGLASIEALYLALRMLGFDTPALLDQYYWKDEFLRQFK